MRSDHTVVHSSPGDAVRRTTALRHVVAGLERAPSSLPPEYLPLGIPEIDCRLFGPGLVCGALHELRPAAHGDRPAAFGFAAALTALGLRSRPGPTILIVDRRSLEAFGRPYGHGLAQLGLDPGRLLLVEVRSERDALWAMEETLRSRAATMVMGSVAGDPNLTLSRRLSLAAGASGTPLLLLRAPETIAASASATRWRIESAPAARDRFGAFARSRWRVALERCRNGRPGQWVLEWDHAAHRFRLAEGLADRAPARGAEQKGLRLVG